MANEEVEHEKEGRIPGLMDDEDRPIWPRTSNMPRQPTTGIAGESTTPSGDSAPAGVTALFSPLVRISGVIGRGDEVFTQLDD